MSTFEEDSHLVRLLLQWSSLNKYYHLEQMTIFQWVIFLKFKRGQVLLTELEQLWS